MRDKQRAIVNAFADAYPDTAWGAGDPVGIYSAQALRLHVEEALGPDPLSDREAEAWLDAKEDPNHAFSKAVANVFTRGTLLKIGERHEAEGHLWLAAKR